MNSYPMELLAQLAPVMFVAGLNPPTSSVPPPVASASPPTSPVSLPTSRAQDPFASLITRLQTTLSAVRQVAIWQSEKAKSFQVVLVDKDVRFPPRKLHPPEDYPDQTPRSPLSPLTPSSPLYPDGLVAPVWIRKHTSFVPSVFVLFLRLFEFPPHTPRSPLDLPDPDRERQREAEERRQDAELAAEIAQRKKATNERSIKLTVVLLATRRMLDDPSLDSRLTYIRRQSGLDSRASLFVLSPVSQSELNEFVQSLQQALYDPAVDYYTSHSKRVRRKRNRHTHGSSINYPTPSVSSVPVSRPLRPEGWTVRYEYKMACFAEFRGEDEVALKHYQDAYSALLLMFASITTLPPRTKRWAEAKVLADSIDIKICKLYLYNNEHSLALAFHNTHIRKFCDFSRVWSVGEDTFEFWSWMARQQRVMAELLEHGMRSTLLLPIHRPSLMDAPITMPSQQGDALTSLGINPAHALQHPAFYYYMSARYTEKRREMFMAALELEARGAGAKLSPGFSNEKKIDHFALIIEMYIRSYELFKQRVPSGASQPNQGRLILNVALLIAQTYYQSEQFDMAIKFFERIAKTYRKEQWDVVLWPLLSIWYSCAQQTGNMELSVRLLLEMLGHGSGIEDSEDLEETLYGVLNSTVPSNQDPLIVELLNFQSIFRTSVHFWETDIYIGQPTAFQLSISMPGNISLSSLSVASVSIYFSDDALTPLVIHHSDGAPGYNKNVRRVALGDVSRYLFDIEDPVGGTEDGFQAYLRWGPNASIVFTGTLQSEIPGILKLAKVVMTVKHNSWWIELPIELNELQNYGDKALETPKWLTSVDPPQYVPVERKDCTTATVRSRPHQLQVFISYGGPAYLNEEFPITIKITNVDDKELDVTFDVILHPPEDDSSVNRIILEDEESMSLIRGVKFGVLEPGAETVKTLYLLNTGVVGDRTLDVSIRSQSTTQLPSSLSARTLEGTASSDTNEKLHTLVIPVTQAIKITSNVTYQRSLQSQAGLADLRTYGNELWEDRVSGEATITSTFQCTASCGLRLESIQLENQDHPTARIIDCSADTIEPEDKSDDWLTGDEFTAGCRVTMSLPEGSKSTIPAPGAYVVRWRRLLPTGEPGPLSTTRFSLPPLTPPMDDLVALLDLPSTGKLHVPMVVKLTTRNNHPSRTAVVTVHLEPDASDGFVIAGLRSGRVPMLLPETETSLYWKLIPIECGFVKVPKFKVIDRRKAVILPGQEPPASPPEPGSDAEGDIVKLVDVRWDGRSESGDEARAVGDVGSVLVVP